MRHTTLLALLSFPVMAFASDWTGEDCDALPFAETGACVAPTAAIDVSVTTTEDSFVGSFASVGPFVALDDVYISPRSVLVGWVAHTTQPLTIGAGTRVGRGASVGADAILGQDTTLSRAVTVGPRLTTGDGAFVGYAANLGADVALDDGAVVGNLVDLGNFTHLGPLAVIARNTTVADAPSSTEGSEILGIVGPNSTIGPNVLIEANARVRKDVTLESGAQILDGARVGRDAVVEAGATVSSTVQAYARVCAGDTIAAGETLRRGMTSQGTASCPPQAGAPLSENPWLVSFTGGNTITINDVVTDDTGTVYVAGAFRVSIDIPTPSTSESGGDNAFVAAFDDESNMLWLTHTTSASSNDYAFEIDEHDGDVYAAGYFRGSITWDSTILTANGTDADPYVLKLDAATGAVEWAVSTGGTDTETFRDLYADATGAYLAGQFDNFTTIGSTTMNSAGGTDALAAHIDDQGVWQWVRRAGGTADDTANAVVIDGSGDLIVGMNYRNDLVTSTDGGANLMGDGSTGTNSNTDVAILQMTTGGTTLSTHTFGNFSTDRIHELHANATHTTMVGSYQNATTFGATAFPNLTYGRPFVGELDASGAPVRGWYGEGIGNATHPISVARSGDNIYMGVLGSGTVIFGSHSLSTSGNAGYVGRVNAATATGPTDWDWSIGSVGSNVFPQAFALSTSGSGDHLYLVGRYVGVPTFGSNQAAPSSQNYAGFMVHIQDGDPAPTW